MSEKLDQFARDLLEKTRAGKLDWKRYLNPAGHGREEYYVGVGDLDGVGDGFFFHVWRRISGDDRTITLQLRPKHQIDAIESVANNWPGLGGGAPLKEAVSRFRLYSDLFDAVRESVYGKEETLGKVEELLRKIG